MDCQKCGNSNPDGSKFCNACGEQLAMVARNSEVMYGVFQPGGYGDGYYTQFGFAPSLAQMMNLVNCQASMSINDPNQEKYLAEISPADWLPEDANRPISQRVRVHSWHRLNWNGAQWEVGLAETNHPESLGLSNFESG